MYKCQGVACKTAAYMFIKLNSPLPQQQYLRSLPELLTAVAELLTMHQPRDVPGLHTARTVQQATRAEFYTLEVLGFELATPTPAAWVEIFRRRLSLRQQQQLLQPPDLRAVPPTILAGCPHRIADARVQSFPLSVLAPQPVRLVPRLGSLSLPCVFGWAPSPRGERACAAGHCSFRPVRVLTQLRCSQRCAWHFLARGVVFICPSLHTCRFEFTSCIIV